MSRKIIFFASLIFSLTLYSQPSVRIFAYEQDVLPGMVRAPSTDANGKPVKKDAVSKNYFIFLTYKKVYKVKPDQVFIRGKLFTIQNIEIKKSPVEYTSNIIPDKPEKTVLVPQTGNTVIALHLSENPLQKKKSPYIQKLTAKNDVVISYIWKKKRYFLTQKQIHKLLPQANE